MLIFYRTPNFSNHLPLSRFSDVEQKARNAIQEHEKKRLAVMWDSVE